MSSARLSCPKYETSVAPFIPLLVAAVVVLLTCMAELTADLNLRDEGYLWYGAQRILVGEVPILDFQSYDPARYYWSGAAMAIAGYNGILPVRVAAYAFQFIGIFAILASLWRDKNKSLTLLLLVAAVLVLWMFPRHKLYDASICLILIAFLANFIRNRDTTSAFLVGLMIGLAACFGRNHGVYGFIGSAIPIIVTSIKDKDLKIPVVGVVGIVAGYLPMILMCALNHEFFLQLIESLTTLVKMGATNLTIPVPWPWSDGVMSTQQFLVGACFVALAALPPLLWWLEITRSATNVQTSSATSSAAAYLSLPYAHFAFSRADVSHLAQGILPLLVFGCIFVCRGRKHTFLLPILLAVSLIVMLPLHPAWLALQGQWKHRDIMGESLRVSDSTAREVRGVVKEVRTSSTACSTFLAVPYWPGAYALTRHRSPAYEIYPIVPKEEAFQQEEIERIKNSNVTLVLLSDSAIDGDSTRKFSYTHSLMHGYLKSSYRPAPSNPDLPGVLVLSAVAKPCTP